MKIGKQIFVKHFIKGAHTGYRNPEYSVTDWEPVESLDHIDAQTWCEWHYSPSINVLRQESNSPPFGEKTVFRFFKNGRNN